MKQVIAKLKKALSILIYLCYLIALIVFITFGTEIATTIKGWITDIMYRNVIDDVTLSIDTEKPIMAGVTKSVGYYPKGKIPSFGAGLRFQSLDPAYLSVNSSGALFVSCDFEGEEISLSYKITSQYDDAFEKIIHVTFVKVYPSQFSVEYRSMGLDTKSPVLYEGVPVHAYVSIPKTVRYGVTDYELLYDERYFVRTAKEELMPIQATPHGETTSISVRYANGEMRSSTPFSILSKTDSPACYDEIQFSNTAYFEEELTYAVGEKITPSAYYQGSFLQSAVLLQFEEGDGGKAVGKQGYFSYSTPGEKQLKVLLPNGFYQTYTLHVLHITKFPEFNVKLNKDGIIEMLDTQTLVYRLHYADDVTYRQLTCVSDESILRVYTQNGNLYLAPKACGTTSFTVIIDDGVVHFEKTYQVSITEDLDFGAYAMRNLEHFLAKVMGHFALFAGLGVVSIFLLRQIPEEKRFAYFILLLVVAFLVGLLTEGIQVLMPDRSGKFRDVLMDTAGYLGGAIVAGTLEQRRIKREIQELEKYGYAQYKRRK